MSFIQFLNNPIFVFKLAVSVDLLPRLLLPLAGPTPDTFDEEDVDKLPIDLQYLDEDKKVEEDADIRKLVLESLLQVIFAE